MGVLKGTSTIIGEIPFTELYERLLNLGRIDSPNNSDYAKGLINDSYTRTLPRLQDWDTMIKSDNLVMVPTVKDGVVSVTAGSTSLTGVGTTFTSAMTAEEGWKISIQGNPDIYTFEYVSATTATISPGLSGAQDMTSRTYQVFKDEYDLAADFDRLLKNGSVYVYTDGRIRDIVKETPRDFFKEEATNVATDPIQRVNRTRINANTGRRMLKINPYPKTARVYPYDYYFKIVPMSEYTTGTVLVTSASTAVVGTDTAWASNVAAGDYLRVDANGIAESSIWYKIATVTDNTNIVLEEAFGEFTEGEMEYTICKTPASFPPEFHEFILYDSLLVVTSEQGDTNATGFLTRREEILTSLKQNYKSRRTNTQFRVGDDGIRSGRIDRDSDMDYRR